METSTLITIITSAAVGAAVSSFVALLGQWFERRAQKKELLLTKAIDLAFNRQELILKASNAAGGRALLRDAVVSAAEYYRLLEDVFDKGTLPDSFLEKVAASLKRHQSANNK